MEWNCADNHTDCRRRFIQCIHTKGSFNELQKFVDHGLLRERPPDVKERPPDSFMWRWSEVEKEREEAGDLIWFMNESNDRIYGFLLGQAPWFATMKFIQRYDECLQYDETYEDEDPYMLYIWNEPYLITLLKFGAFEGECKEDLQILYEQDVVPQNRVLAVMQMLIMCQPVCVPRLKQSSPLGVLNRDIMRLLIVYLA